MNQITRVHQNTGYLAQHPAPAGELHQRALLVLGCLRAPPPHLRHDGGGHLDEVHTTLVGGSRKAGHVANHAAAERDEGGVAVQPARVAMRDGNGAIP